VAPLSNPPTAYTLVSGSGFSAGADVDIYFDTADLALAVTDDTGSFSQIALHVPASALPGEHTVSAVDRSTGASAQTPFRVDTRWAQFHKRVSHDGYNVGENVLSPTTVGGLSLLWESYGTGFSSPAVANGVVYVGSAYSRVFALNAATGSLLWKYKTGNVVSSSPAVASGVVYFGSQDNNVYALNASTGALRWKYTTGGAVLSSPAVANGVVYVGSEDRNVYALNASTGALLWKYTTGSAFSSPAVANGVVYVGSLDGKVYALKAGTGALLWKYTTGREGDSSPAVANGVVYVGLYPDHSVYALKAGTGALLWQYTTGSYVDSSPAVANGVVYVGSGDFNVYAFGLKGSDAPAVPQRPDPQTLSPDLSLPVSSPTAKLPATDE